MAARQGGEGELAHRLMADMGRITDARIGGHSLANARANREAMRHGRSIAALRGQRFGKSDRAVVVAAGPSLHRQESLSRLAASGYDGMVITTDSGVLRCLRHGIVPDLVVTVDPDDAGIVRWFGDPDLDASRLEDDYFRRQDMDELFRDEVRTNREMLALMQEFGPKLRIALSTSAGPRVVRRVIDCGMDIYWFNPMLDDPEAPASRSRALLAENRMPLINCGGNVGSACWMIADAVLGVPDVALLGIDFSYYDGTPFLNTQYYHEAKALVGDDRIETLYPRIFNPQVERWFFTDPAYLWYREVFLQMEAEADCRTWNCTEGGILMGERIRCEPIETFVRETARG